MTQPAISPPPTPGKSTGEHDRHFNVSLDLLCISGLDGYFKEVNPSWTRVLGWSHDEFLARPVEEFIHPEDRERTLLARAGLAQGISLQNFENRYLCKDGSYRWLSWQSTVEAGGATVFGVARDVTERRQTENEQIIMGKLNSTGILAGGIAHDFNNLLSGLMMNVEMIRLTGSLSPQQKIHVDQALGIAHAAHAVTQQLLTFASGGDSVRRPVDLSPLLQQSLDLALGGSKAKGDLQVAPSIWSAQVDEEQIAQVVRNLVLNAREVTPPGGVVTLRAENTVLDASSGIELPPGNYLHFSVVDSGPGIPPEILPKIFDPYFSTKQRGTQKGMGLGLTICHSIIRKHGGSILIDSKHDAGTTVHCYLPASSESAPEFVQPEVSAPIRSSKILIMDDEEIIRSVLTQALVQLGYAVESAKDGGEAITIFEAAGQHGAPFDAVLLDLTVKAGLGGTETIRLLRQKDPAVKAVLLTGYSQEQTFRDYASHGFSAALSKPFQIEKLRDLLARVLSSERAIPLPIAG